MKYLLKKVSKILFKDDLIVYLSYISPSLEYKVLLIGKAGGTRKLVMPSKSEFKWNWIMMSTVLVSSLIFFRSGYHMHDSFVNLTGQNILTIWFSLPGILDKCPGCYNAVCMYMCVYSEKEFSVYVDRLI